MLLLTAVMHFGIQPAMDALKLQAGSAGIVNSTLSSRFAVWHGVSSVLYLAVSLLGIWLVRCMNRLVH